MGYLDPEASTEDTFLKRGYGSEPLTLVGGAHRSSTFQIRSKEAAYGCPKMSSVMAINNLIPAPP
jgi:hypothetical protein